jgi:hypothetical protein
MADYPEMETLIGGWFHQDFDINGESLDEIVAAYRAVTPKDQQRALVAELRRYLAEESDVERDFEQRFRPDGSPTGFAPTTRELLEKIASLVDEQ